MKTLQVLKRTHAQTQASISTYSMPTFRGPNMQLHVFIPKGDHAPKSLPCVFLAPAGTNLLVGSETEDPVKTGEFDPYLNAGMAVAHFSLDGWMPIKNPRNPLFGDLLIRAYQEFAASDAGVMNGQQAIELVLSEFPTIDPKRLYTAGHSSAATLALLLASEDKRISKCIAFAPITDLTSRMDEALTDPSFERMLPGVRGYFRTGSPITYVKQLKCDVWIAHAKDDDNEPYVNTEKFVKALRDNKGKVQILSLDRGGHYQEMLDVAIPQALSWLQGRSQ